MLLTKSAGSLGYGIILDFDHLHFYSNGIPILNLKVFTYLRKQFFVTDFSHLST